MRDAVSRLYSWLARSDSDSDEPAGDVDVSDDDSGGFAGSLLDASVRRGHGQGDPRAASEIAAVQEETARLTEQDQYRDE
ncbi:MAG: hypothetical protein ABEH86_13195 [Haloarcula sp.]